MIVWSKKLYQMVKFDTMTMLVNLVLAMKLTMTVGVFLIDTCDPVTTYD